MVLLAVEAEGAAHTTMRGANRGWISRASLGWALYDLANTLFAFTVITFYFPLWVVDDMGGRDSTYGLASSVSMAVTLLAAPLVGALMDQVPRRLPYLVLSTVICSVATFVIGSGDLRSSIALFIVANVAFQAGTIVYDTLLPAVSEEDDRGRVSGLGVGVGYLGSVVALGVGSTVLHIHGDRAEPLIFKLSAILFVAFATPCFLWVAEVAPPIAPRADHLLRRTTRELRATVGRARRYPNLCRFLLGRLFYVDAANTLIVFIGIYATKELGFAGGQINLLIGLSVAGAAVGGVICGRMVDRFGSKRTLVVVLRLWIGVLAITPAISYLGLPRELFWLLAPVAGIGYGGLAAADRPFLFVLAPERYAGQMYGLYAMVGRFASLVGPLVWAAVAEWLGLGRPAAILALLGMILAGYVVLGGVDDERPSDERLPRGDQAH